MKVDVLKENLSKALNTVGRIVSTKNALPVLSHVLISTEEGRLKLASTNLELGITYKIGGKITESGSITVPSRFFSDLINSLPNDKISLNLEDLTLKVNCQNFKSDIKGLSAEEFPLIPNIKENKVVSISSGDFKEAIKLVSFAVAVEESRPALSGIYLNKEEKNLTFVATDSYRLAEKTVILPKDLGSDFAVIIPLRAIQEIYKIVSDTEGEVNIYLSENQVLFEVDGIELISRLIEGKFPDYKQIIPESSQSKAIIKATDFSNTLKVALLFAKENANTVNVNINPKGKIEINVEASQVGNNESFLEAEVEGKGGEISFNGKFIIDVLQNLNAYNVSLEISSAITPGVIKSVDVKNYVYVIMPLGSKS